jgi:hypothetical protein
MQELMADDDFPTWELPDEDESEEVLGKAAEPTPLAADPTERAWPTGSTPPSGQRPPSRSPMLFGAA